MIEMNEFYQGYLLGACILSLQDKRIKTYTLGELTKDRKKPAKYFDHQGMVKYTEGDNT